MSVISRLLPENPVLTKEMRVRMRGARAYWILLGYLGFLTAVLLFTYQGWEHEVAMTGTGASESAETGKNIYNVLLICQAFLVLFITPAITSGSITIEKEQQTLDMLTMTRLSRASMVIGKLVSAVSFTALLLLSSLPLVSICFMLGGVDPAMVFSTYLAMLMGSFLIGAVGLMWSSVVKTTTVAVLLTYLSMLGFAVVMGFAVTAYGTMKSVPIGVGGGGVGWFAVAAVIQTWCAAGFLGTQNIEYVGFALFSVLAGVLLSAITMSRLETWPERRAGLLRGLTAALVLLQVGACTVWWLERIYGVQGLGVANSPAIGALCIPLLLLMLLVPTFATGEVSPSEARRFGRYLLWGWTPKGLTRGKLASGIPFLLLLTAACIGVYVLTFVCFGKTKDLMKSASLPGMAATAPLPTVAPSVARGYSGAVANRGGVTVYRNGVAVVVNGRPVVNPPPTAPPSPTAPVHTGFWDTVGDFPQAVILILTFVVGFALVCQFLSVAFNNRWVACALAYLVLFLVLILPSLSAAMGENGTPWITVNFAYFNPFCAFGEMTEGAGGSFGNWAVHALAFGGVPFWLATSAAWTVVGALSFIATLPFVARRAMRSKAIAYEEMAVPA
jgi:ABC-type transport system involved in multi-copper enzyme maturation permease subunit